MKNSSAVVLIIFILVVCIGSIQVGIKKGRALERAKLDTEKHDLVMKKIDYEFELSRCRGWVDALGEQIMRERG